MRYTTIGSDSPAAREVSVLSLGTMWFGTRTDEATAFAILDRYVAAGGNFIDTSNNYLFYVNGTQGGESEALLGRWRASRGIGDEIELRADPRAVGAQEREPLGLVAFAGADHLGVAAHLADRHAGRPQLGDQLEPAEVALGVATVPRAGPVDPEHQPVALVVAQRVPRQADALGDLGDGQFGGRHASSLAVGARSKSNASGLDAGGRGERAEYQRTFGIK